MQRSFIAVSANISLANRRGAPDELIKINVILWPRQKYFGPEAAAEVGNFSL